jgi:pyruvate formate lyase activating enzyme
MGYIHSLESFGSVDGPGVRFVVFFQGCPMRCAYCHNPDSWTYETDNLVSVEEILAKYNGVKEFCTGGITVTGGEPLVQIDFVTELFKKAQEKEIHTALDTSGILFNQQNLEKIDELLKYTSLVLLDIKHIDEDEHKKLTGHSNKNILEFARFLEKHNVPLWVRRVAVEGWTDGREENLALGRFLATLKNLKALDVLPYHSLGESKYKELGIEYPLAGLSPMARENIPRIKKEILEGMGKI